MGTNNILIVLLPLFAYVLIEMKMGFKAGMIAAVGISLGLLIWEYVSFGEIDNNDNSRSGFNHGHGVY